MSVFYIFSKSKGRNLQKKLQATKRDRLHCLKKFAIVQLRKILFIWLAMFKIIFSVNFIHFTLDEWNESSLVLKFTENLYKKKLNNRCDPFKIKYN